MLARLLLTRPAAAAIAVDAAAGLLAGCAANQLGAGHQAAAVFALAALACIGCHLVLLPGLVWAAEPVRIGNLLRRAVLAGLAVVLTVMAGLCCGMALAALPNPFGPGPGWAAAAESWSGRAMLAMMLAGAGALVGLGAAAADTLDRRPSGSQVSPAQPGFKAHAWGGAIAVLPILPLAWAADTYALGPDLMVRQTWPALPGLTASALVLAGLPHTLLVLSGFGPAVSFKPVLRRAAIVVLACCCAALGLTAGTLPAATRPLHVSPDGRYAVLLVSDTAFGQVEELRVIADPGTPAVRVIFEQLGDKPLRFMRWSDVGTAELAYADHAEDRPADLTLTCQGQTCRLD